MTKIRRIALTLAASSAIGSLAVLSPLAAQAKTADWLDTTGKTDIPMAACFGAPGSAVGHVAKVSANAGTYSIKVTGDVRDFEFRARYGYWDATKNKMVFAKDKQVNPAGTPTFFSGSLNKPQLVIYRLDVVDPAAAQLVYTSAGAVGCD